MSSTDPPTVPTDHLTVPTAPLTMPTGPPEVPRISALPSSLEEFIKLIPNWSEYNLSYFMKIAGFVASTSQWGSSQMIAYRVIRKRDLDIKKVFPFFDETVLDSGGISEVEQALSPAGIKDAKIETDPSHKLMVQGGIFGSFFLHLGKVLETTSDETTEARLQPPRMAKTHQRYCSISSEESIAASRESDPKDHPRRDKSEVITASMLLAYLQGVTSVYDTKIFPGEDDPGKLLQFESGGSAIIFPMAGETKSKCTSVNDGSLYLAGSSKTGRWVKCDLRQYASIEVKRVYGLNPSRTNIAKPFRVECQEAGELIALAHLWTENHDPPQSFTVFSITAAQNYIYFSSAAISTLYQEYFLFGETQTDIAKAHLVINETKPLNLAKQTDRIKAAKLVLAIRQHIGQSLKE